MGDVILYKEDVERLNFLLKNLIVEAKILSALLITKDTRVLACQGSLASDDTTALAALLVGSFASTQAIAGLIGETEFDTMSHRGKTRNVIISLVDQDTILASIFDNSTSASRIAASMNKHLDVLKKSLKAIGGNTTQDLFASGEPQAAADDVSFEKRTEDFFKGIEADQVEEKLAVEVPVGNKRSPDIHLTDSGHPEPALLPKDEQPQKPQPVVVGHSIEHPVSPRITKTDEVLLSSKDYEVYTLKEPANHPLHQPMHSVEKRPLPPQSPKTDAMNLSMSYLKNKAHEGAVYYHQDKTFLKKIFRSAKKKKSETGLKTE
jgi:predicted regulator of Ras-like GTPase activity (Roadblock/LC7/MglB family)